MYPWLRTTVRMSLTFIVPILFSMPCSGLDILVGTPKGPLAQNCSCLLSSQSTEKVYVLVFTPMKAV